MLTQSKVELMEQDGHWHGYRILDSSSSQEIWRRIKYNDLSLRYIFVGCCYGKKIGRCVVEDQDLVQLGEDIGRNTALLGIAFRTTLNLNRIRAICQGINRNQTIRKIMFSDACNESFICLVQSLSNFLEKNDKLQVVDCHGCQIEIKGGRCLARSLTCRKTPLTRLTLGQNIFFESALKGMFRVYKKHPNSTPHQLAVWPGDASKDFCVQLHQLLKTPNCTLKVLGIENLGMYYDLFEDLFDVSTIDSAYFSNHFLRHLGSFEHHDPNTWNHLCEILTLNRNSDKKSVAYQKVVRYHFNDCFKIHPFVGMAPDLLVRITGFMDKAVRHKIGYDGSVINIEGSNRLSILFQLLRDNPHVCNKMGGAESGEVESSVEDSRESEGKQSSLLSAKRRKVF